jgi:small subunit ribosomal protein S6
LVDKGKFQPFRSYPANGSRQGQSQGKEDPDMQKYELVVIISPDQEETALNALIDKIKGWITDGGGQIDSVDNWGKRRLAYLIRKQREGVYVIFKVQMPAAQTAVLEHNLRLQEVIMRFLITRMDQ